jgi:hypothetical protein
MPGDKHRHFIQCGHGIRQRSTRARGTLFNGESPDARQQCIGGIAPLDDRNGRPSFKVRGFLAAVCAALIAAAASGCTPDMTFASLSDSDMQSIFPTEWEIQSTLGTMDRINPRPR